MYHVAVHHVPHGVEFSGLKGKRSPASARDFSPGTLIFTLLLLFLKAATERKNWLTFLLLPRCLIPSLSVTQTKIFILTAAATAYVNLILSGGV